jgi:hypothetical protein
MGGGTKEDGMEKIHRAGCRSQLLQISATADHVRPALVGSKSHEGLFVVVL